MDIRFVINQLALLMLVLSGLLLGIGLWAGVELWRGDGAEQPAFEALMVAGLGGMALGGVVWWITRGTGRFGRREALLLVALSWFIGAALGALPMHLWAVFAGQPDHPFATPIDCYFEAMSGFTTTGATILPNIETLPASMLLWRSMTHWLGGLGIVVLFVAVLPGLAAGGKRLYQGESSAPRGEALHPHIRETAQTLWVLYMGMTVLCILGLRATGAMGWFDAICHTMSMVSTGGLSTKNASIGAYDSVSVDVICIFFMLAAGVNFALFHDLRRGRWRHVLRDTELRVYLALKVIVIALVAANLYWTDAPITTTAGGEYDATAGQALRFGAFQTVALHTGTGFGTADYEIWPYVTQVLLVGLMFIGGCAGSTAGGIKVVRFWLVLKIVWAELEKAFRPNVVRPVRLGRHALEHDQKVAALVFVIAFIMLWAGGAAVVYWFEQHQPDIDFLTTASASLSTLGNIGPGLHEVGPTDNYAWFTGPSKLLMAGLMALGRLEMFTILVLLTPRFWRND